MTEFPSVEPTDLTKMSDEEIEALIVNIQERRKVIETKFKHEIELSKTITRMSTTNKLNKLDKKISKKLSTLSIVMEDIEKLLRDYTITRITGEY